MRLARQRERPLHKEEIARISRQVWADAGAVAARDVRRELKRAASRAGLSRIPTPKDVRHLFESMCEEAMLGPGVIRHLMGHAPQRGDALFNYVSLAALREQVAVLDARRKPLLDALLRRASELASPPRLKGLPAHARVPETAAEVLRPVSSRGRV